LQCNLNVKKDSYNTLQQEEDESYY